MPHRRRSIFRATRKPGKTGWIWIYRSAHTCSAVNCIRADILTRPDSTEVSAEGMNTDHLYTVNGRLVVDMTESYPWLTWLGVGVSYIWSGNVSGWSVGIDARLKL